MNGSDLQTGMQIKQQTGCMGPDSFDDSSTEGNTPDPQMLDIMRNYDPNAKFERAAPSSWDRLSPEERETGEPITLVQHLESQEEMSKLYDERGDNEAIEPISGVSYSKTRIYGRHEGGKWIFFGVREPGMRMREFWAKYDPGNTRGDCGGSDLSLSASPEPVASNPRVGASSKRSQQTSTVNGKNRVRKSATPPPTANTRTRRLLAFKGNSDSTDVLQLSRQLHVEAFGRYRPAPASKTAQITNDERRPARKKTSSEAAAAIRSTKQTKKQTSLALHPEARAPTTEKDRKVMDIPALQRRAPALKKLTSPAKKKQKSTIARGNAKVTKQKKVKERAPASSAHRMRTRAQGPAENLQLP